MLNLQPITTSPVSPLVLSDRLIRLAQDADSAGYRSSASLLVSMAYAVFDETPARAAAAANAARSLGATASW